MTALFFNYAFGHTILTHTKSLGPNWFSTNLTIFILVCLVIEEKFKTPLVWKYTDAVQKADKSLLRWKEIYIFIAHFVQYSARKNNFGAHD